MHSNISCFLKCGNQGATGTGKSYTSLMLALGITVVLGDKAPVYCWDSEPGWQFYQPIFAAENVPFIHKPNRSFKSLTASLSDAKREGAAVHVIDQLAVPWRDLTNSFADDSGYIGMNRQIQLRRLWDEFVLEWKDLPMHAIVNGRLGWEYEDFEQDGHRQSVKADTKMRAGGSESFGYEPYLTCEFSNPQETEHSPAGKRKKVRHLCTVLKDQTSVLNGSQFEFKDLRYKPGDFKFVFREFLPHLEFLQQIASAPLPRENSKALLKTESYWQKFDRERTALLEDWDTTIEKIAGGRTAAAESIRRLIFESIAHVRSRTRFEQFDVKDLERCVLELMAVEEMVKTGEKVEPEETTIKSVVQLAQARLYRGEKKSVMEVQLEMTLKQQKGASA